MDCRITSIKEDSKMRFFKHTFKPARAGMTLVEVMVATAVSSIVLLALASVSYISSRNFVSIANYSDLDHDSRDALDRFSQAVRQTKGLTAFTSTSLTFLDYDETPLEFVYNSSAKTLTRIKGGVAEVWLDQCDYLKWDLYQRTPIGGVYDFYPVATTVNTTKIIQVSWICSRKIMGAKANTESVQSAKIVIRKHKV